MGSRKKAVLREKADTRKSQRHTQGNKDSREPRASVKPRPRPKILKSHSASEATALEDSEAAQLLVGLRHGAPDSLSPDLDVASDTEPVSSLSTWRNSEDYFSKKEAQLDNWVMKQNTRDSQNYDETATTVNKQPPLKSKASSTPQTHPKSPTNVSSDSERNSTEEEAFDIRYDLEKDGVLYDFTLSSGASFSTFLTATAKAFNVSVSHLGALGYIPSFRPKNPKPLPKIVHSDESYEKMLEDLEDYVESLKSRKGKGKVKSFTVRLLDTSGPGTRKDIGKKSKTVGKVVDASTPALTEEDNSEEHILYRKIEKAHHCDQHGKACWVRDNGSHYQLTTSEITQWALLMKIHKALVDKPPDSLLDSIENDTGVSRFRGRTRAVPAMPTATPSPWNTPYPPSYPPWAYPPFPTYPYPSPMPPAPGRATSPHSSPGPTSSPSVTPSKRSLIDIPHISEWLEGVDKDDIRGQDGLQVSQYSDALETNGIIRISDLVDVEVNQLMAMIGANWGVANRLVKYAKEDMGQINKMSKKSRH
ncbi:hypothetical protein DFH05DRAFT_1529212 [Lentinula detonsa]|uniref:Uncharacterized protein n=1 Tax=Lentinula detonsa TaxID=2804962 RepID=A0A9W8TUF9_9AGAR|nr:hypothetical protein DFH05DRAFT_1529212 [Lentinula detonsa]